MSLERKLGVVFFAAVVVRLLFHYLTVFTADDAFITFRYAENIAGGVGYVYNAGEFVQGTTTPLFTFILALFAVFGLPMPTVALGVTLVCSGLTATVIYRYANALRMTRWAGLAAAAYIVFPRSLAADSGGMETALFSLLVITAFYFQYKRLDIYAIGMATLATVTRPEGVLLLGLLLVHNLYKHRDRWLSYLLVPAVIVGPWLLFAYFYFGSIIPNSVAAKLALYSRFGAGSVWDRLVYLMSWHNPLGWIMFALAIPGLWWLHKKVLSGRLEAIWILMMLAFYVFSNTLLFFWYVAPLYPVYLLLVAASVPWAVERLRFNVIRERKLAPFVYALMVLVLLAGCYRPVMYYRDFQESMTHVHREVGLYLKTRAAENDLVAAEDIGLMGYLSGLRILDRDGLVSPEAIPYNRTGDYLGLIQDYRPDWVVATNSPISGFVTDSAFLAHYQQDTLYSRQDMTCRVFSRRP